MSTNSYMLKVGVVEALVVRKAIKNLHLSVLPPNGRVRVTAPTTMKEDAIRTLLATRLGWINRQQARFRDQERQTPREYVSGENHYFLGKRYRLELRQEDSPPRVEVRANGKIILFVRPKTSQRKREEIVTEWYRRELRTVLGEIINKWKGRIGVTVSRWDIKRMKTRWGTCNKETGRILLNLELAKKPLHCIEYVVVHELVHLIEKRHNDRFVELMTKYLPQWESRKDELNRLILSHEKWSHCPTQFGGE